MRVVTFAAVVFIIAIIVSCGGIATEKVYHNGSVVCSEATAARTGVDVLRGGGNAVDAACATALALAVTYPEAGNIGGGGFALVYMADSGKVFYLDFREKAPAQALPEMYLDSSGHVDPGKSLLGPLAAGVPGTVAGLYDMHRRFGQRIWSSLVKPARLLADTGIIIDSQFSAAIAESADEIGNFDASQEIFLPNGRPPQPGSRFKQRDLATSLIRIEREGKDGFYTGATADAIIRYCAENGGLITQEDLSGYRAVWREPTHVTYHGLDVYAAGLPSSGGIVLGQILKMLEYFELEKYTPKAPEYIHLFAEASRRAFADRSEYLGDPDFVMDPSDDLLDSMYIRSRVTSIDLDHVSSSAETVPGMPKGYGGSDQTTHLVVADEHGNIVSLTYTINSWYGCKAVVPGAGFFLNNEMDDFALMPDAANQYGLTGGEANSLAGGKRMLSSMTPTIVFQKGRPYLALGSPGGSKIISAIAQTIVKYHVYNLPLSAAVMSPRIHHQWRPDTLYLEEGGFEASTVSTLKAMGHHVIERSPFGEVTAIGFSQNGTFMTGVADLRRGGGAVAGY